VLPSSSKVVVFVFVVVVGSSVVESPSIDFGVFFVDASGRISVVEPSSASRSMTGGLRVLLAVVAVADVGFVVVDGFDGVVDAIFENDDDGLMRTVVFGPFEPTLRAYGSSVTRVLLAKH
jgi:hypothetical protein